MINPGASAVALKSTGFALEVLARITIGPAFAPKLKPICTCPLSSVRPLLASSVAEPLTTYQLMVSSKTGRLSLLVSRTTSGESACVSTRPD